jgi:hypothetical protein
LPANTKPIPEVVQELWELLKDYAKQETVDPVKDLGRFLKWGLTGAVMLALGIFFLALSLLRVLQTQTGGAFDDGWLSALPYLIVLVGLVLVAGITAWRIGKGMPEGDR